MSSSINTEDKVLDVVEDVIADLNDKILDYKNDQTLTLEDKAIPLSEVRVALILLNSIKKSSANASRRTRISNCLNNQQLMFLANKVMSYNDELVDEIELLNTVRYYQIPELES